MALNKSHIIARLTKARDQIANGRWRRGQLIETRNGKLYSFCAIGALNAVDPGFKVIEGTWNQTDTNRDLIRACTDELNDTSFRKANRNIINFNDHAARDKRDVIRLYDATIKRLKAS